MAAFKQTFAPDVRRPNHTPRQDHIHNYIYNLYIYIVINIYGTGLQPPPPPPAMVMVPRVGCTISLESNYHARYLCFPAPACGVGWV